MSEKKMHADEFDIDEALVRQLLCAQFPQWATLSVIPVQSMGTDNAIYLIGNDMCVRLPRIARSAQLIKKEQSWLPQFSRALPLAVPELLGAGSPSNNYPWHWSIYRWLEGEDAACQDIIDQDQAAIDLAQFLRTFQQINTVGGPVSRRGVPLSEQERETYTAITSLHGVIDTDAVSAVWQECLRAPVWDKPPVWTHGDLLPANLLVKDGRLSAVIDFGCLGVGDPACDLIVAWSVLSYQARGIFRQALAVDDATWMRGKGWALSIALIALPYYKDTNPGLVAVAKRMINEILSE